jgi:hypothetical protein
MTTTTLQRDPDKFLDLIESEAVQSEDLTRIMIVGEARQRLPPIQKNLRELQRRLERLERDASITGKLDMKPVLVCLSAFQLSRPTAEFLRGNDTDPEAVRLCTGLVKWIIGSDDAPVDAWVQATLTLAGCLTVLKIQGRYPFNQEQLAESYNLFQAQTALRDELAVSIP